MFHRLINIGVQIKHRQWEKHLTRKLNLITAIAIFNLIVGIIYFYLFGFSEFIIPCIVFLLLFPLVYLSNKYINYIFACYVFYIAGIIFMILMSLKMGKESNFIIYYFPVILSIIQILGRRELLKHVVFLGSISFLSFLLTIFLFRVVNSEIELESRSELATFNLIICFLTTSAFIIIMVRENLRQERNLRQIVRQKEILLSEVFHRVKNNMNIIISLLNLKKSLTDSTEVKMALEECKNRIYSMALVHDTVFNNEGHISLNFNEYIENLVAQLINSFMDSESVSIKYNIEVVEMDLSIAIPCGLIVNELITNCIKHAVMNDRNLEIQIKLTNNNNLIDLELRDNGPGINFQIINPQSLGLELIKSLTQQIDGEYSLSNESGTVFKLRFKNLRSELKTS